MSETPKKLSFATVWLDGCSGCHMSLLDIDFLLLELAERVDVVYSPLVDFKVFPEMVDLTLVEGAIGSEEDLHKIRKVRAHTRTLLALGDCAVNGNVPAMRNLFSVREVQERAYFETADFNQRVPDRIIPRLLEREVPVHTAVKVDVFLPGCPPSAENIGKAILSLLDGNMPDIPPRFGQTPRGSR